MSSEARERILREVASERVVQDYSFGPAHDDQHDDATWIALITEHAGRAMTYSLAGDIDSYRVQLIRVAALAVAAVEAFDRRAP